MILLATDKALDAPWEDTSLMSWPPVEHLYLFSNLPACFMVSGVVKK